MQAHGRRPVLATLWAGQTDGRWEDVADVWDRPMRWSDPIRFAAASRGRQAVLLRGSVTLHDRYRDILFALAIRVLMRPRSRPRVVISDATWEPRSRALEAKFPRLAPILPFAIRLMVRAIDGDHVRYAVLSTDEAEGFPAQWKVPRARVGVTLFPSTLRPADANGLEVRDGGFVFAGGDSMRDYDLLMEALDLLGNPPTIIAAQWAPAEPRRNLQYGPVPHAEFLRLMAQARVCVVPLARSSRSAGQQTYLNSMKLGKPTVVTDAAGVREYIDDGGTAFVSPADPASLASTIGRVLSAENLPDTREVAARGALVVSERFTVAHYRADLLRLCGLDV